MKDKYRTTLRLAGQFGNKTYVFVIERKTWLGFYWNTDEYYFNEEHAQKRCDELNLEFKKIKNIKNLKFYKYWFAPIKIKQFIPSFSFSKNVQGWFFTRNWSINWFRYCILFTITIISDFDIDRNIAHEINVAQYMLR